MEVSNMTGSDLRRFGRYLLAQRIAHGGMASVHLAQLKGEKNFAKWVAVKVIHRQYAGDPKFERMFLNEAKLLARIDHPNVCSVFDFGEVAGTYFLAMEYLHGQTLQRVMKEAQADPTWLSWGCAAKIIADAADGLHAAHELVTEDGHTANVVHRDVSPQNLVVLYSGVTKVLDFGIARSEDREEEFTSVDEIKGKLAYMAPEQLRREPLDRRSDVFSLGIVLWELTCGRRLFKRKHEGETVMALLSEPIPTPTSIVPGYPQALEKIVMRALERDREQRYQTAAEMALALEQFIVESGKAWGHTHVAEAMHTLFSREIEEHTSSLKRSAELLNQIKELSVPDLEVDMEVGEPVQQSGSVSTTLTTGRSRSWLAIPAVLLLAALALGAWWLSRRPETPPAQTAAAQPAAPAPAAAEPAAPPPTATTPETTPPIATAPQSPSLHSFFRNRLAAKKLPLHKNESPSTAPMIAAPAVAVPPAKPQPKAAVKEKENDEAPRPMTSFE